MGLDLLDILLPTITELFLSSEMGVLRVPKNQIIEKFRLRPGKMLLVDLEAGKIINDEELKETIINKKDYKKIIRKA